MNNLSLDRWIILAIAIINAIQIVGRWTGKIDVTTTQLDVEIKKLEKVVYKVIQDSQKVVGELGIAQRDLAVAINNIGWIKNIVELRKTNNK